MISQSKRRKEMERRQRRALADGFYCLGDRLRGDPAFAQGLRLEGAAPDEFRQPPQEGRVAFFASRGRDPTGLSYIHTLDAPPLTKEDIAGQEKARQMFLEWRERMGAQRASRGKPVTTQWQRLKAQLREALGKAKAAGVPAVVTAAPA